MCNFGSAEAEAAAAAVSAAVAEWEQQQQDPPQPPIMSRGVGELRGLRDPRSMGVAAGPAGQRGA